MFSYELQRRLAAAGLATAVRRTRATRAEFGRDMSALVRVAMSWLRPLTWWLMQSPRVGALATVRAATDPAARGGEYFGRPAGPSSPGTRCG